MALEVGQKILDNEKNHEILEIKNNKHIDILSYSTPSKYLTETKPDIVINLGFCWRNFIWL